MWSLALLMLFAQTEVRTQEAGRKQAYVVGIDRYDQFPLVRAVSDARQVAAALGAAGFQTKSLLNLDLRGLSGLVDLMEKEAGPDSTIFLYFAGHGIQIQGENFLVPRDFRPNSEADAPFAAYGLSRILSRLEAKKPRALIVVLDACRSNPFRRARATAGGLAPVQESVGSIVMFATGDGRTAADNGLFARELSRQLQRAPGRDVRDVFRQVKEQVYLQSGKAQIPYIYDGLVAPLFLNGGRDLQVVEAAPLVRQDEPQPEVAPARAAGNNSAVAAEAMALLRTVERLEASLQEQGLGLNVPLATARNQTASALERWRKEEDAGGATVETSTALQASVAELRRRLGRKE